MMNPIFPSKNLNVINKCYHCNLTKTEFPGETSNADKINVLATTSDFESQPNQSQVQIETDYYQDGDHIWMLKKVS
jgi:hypothetical protein